MQLSSLLTPLFTVQDLICQSAFQMLLELLTVGIGRGAGIVQETEGWAFRSLLGVEHCAPSAHGGRRQLLCDSPERGQLFLTSTWTCHPSAASLTLCTGVWRKKGLIPSAPPWRWGYQYPTPHRPGRGQKSKALLSHPWPWLPVAFSTLFCPPR